MVTVIYINYMIIIEFLIDLSEPPGLQCTPPDGRGRHSVPSSFEPRANLDEHWWLECLSHALTIHQKWPIMLVHLSKDLVTRASRNQTVQKK